MAVQFVLIVAAFLLAVFVTSPFVFLDAGSAVRELSMAREHMQFGHFGDATGPALVSYAHDWVSKVMGLPLGVASVAGLVYFALWRRTAWAIVSAGFFAPFVAIVGSWSRVADYYLLPLIPLGTIFATSLVAASVRRAIPAPPASWRAALVVLATVAFAAPSGRELRDAFEVSRRGLASDGSGMDRGARAVRLAHRHRGARSRVGDHAHDDGLG